MTTMTGQLEWTECPKDRECHGPFAHYIARLDGERVFDLIYEGCIECPDLYGRKDYAWALYNAGERRKGPNRWVYRTCRYSLDQIKIEAEILII